MNDSLFSWQGRPRGVCWMPKGMLLPDGQTTEREGFWCILADCMVHKIVYETYEAASVWITKYRACLSEEERTAILLNDCHRPKA